MKTSSLLLFILLTNISFLYAQKVYIYDIKDAPNKQMVVNGITVTYSDGSIGGGVDNGDTGEVLPGVGSYTQIRCNQETIDGNVNKLKDAYYVKLSFSQPVLPKNIFGMGDVDGSKSNVEFVSIIGQYNGALVYPAYNRIGSKLNTASKNVQNFIPGLIDIPASIDGVKSNATVDNSTSGDANHHFRANFRSQPVTEIYFIFCIEGVTGLKNSNRRVGVSALGFHKIEEHVNLPIELVSFTAKSAENKIELNWLTASEENNEYFEVQRSADAQNWETLQVVEGQGTTLDETAYTVVDMDARTASMYYRLKQVDTDANFTYSEVVFVENNTPATTLVKPYPNPFNNILQVANTASETMMIQIVDGYGRTIESINVPAFSQEIINTNNWSSGVYWLRTMSDGRYLSTAKLIKS